VQATLYCIQSLLEEKISQTTVYKIDFSFLAPHIELLSPQPIYWQPDPNLLPRPAASAAMPHTCTHDTRTRTHALRQDGSTGLIMAAQNCHEAVVRLLLERGAEVDKASQVKCT
jgi:hypothetical protein